VHSNENDISTEEEIKSQGTWLQIQDENCRRQKGIICQESKRKKDIIRIS
jgi:hypothetical protein